MSTRSTTQVWGLVVASVISCAGILVAATDRELKPMDELGTRTTTPEITAGEHAFIEEAASLSALGAELARMAESGAGSAEMQVLGMELRAEHARSLAALRELARRKGIKLDPDLCASHEAVIHAFAKKRGADFDAAYQEQVLRNHQAAIRLLADAAQHSRDLDIRMLAERSLGEMKERLAAMGGEAVRLEGGIAASLPKPARSVAAKEPAAKTSRAPSPLDPAIAWAFREQARPIAAPEKPRQFDARSLWKVPAPVASAATPRPSPMGNSAGNVPAPTPRLVPRVGELSGRGRVQPPIIIRQIPQTQTYRIISREY